MNAVEIRWAELKDCHDLSIVHWKSYRAAYRGILPDKFLNEKKPEDRANHFRNACLTGATQIALITKDNNMIGYIEIGKSADEDLAASFAELFAIYFVQEHSGKGYGKQLTDWVLRHVAGLGYRHASLWVLKENANAIKFYEKLNFVFDGAERTIDRGAPVVQLRFRKALI
ncbi:GNAT family N-acetyltransferase [Paenibacillus sp. NPDC058071]|uniref:GNAT family N-acetyltransferase n=1 Tax=Paenibacillus sp. NPDC058071 TaxID=3346326 RepID=UPI0036DC1B65